MSTEKEQLELAARACGLIPKGFGGNADFMFGVLSWFKPHLDDGDCARMEAQLDLSITPYPVYDNPKHSVLVERKAHAECPNALPPLRYCTNCHDPCQRKQPISKIELYADHAGDKNAARRAASVAVAAEIGRLK